MPSVIPALGSGWRTKRPKMLSLTRDSRILARQLPRILASSWNRMK